MASKTDRTTFFRPCSLSCTPQSRIAREACLNVGSDIAVPLQHHGSLRPDHVRAKPSLTSWSPADLPSTVNTASVRP